MEPKVISIESALAKQEWPKHTIGDLPLLISPLLADCPQLTHAFTTRLGGESLSPFDSFNLGRHTAAHGHEEDALNNRKKLCSVLGLDFKRLAVPAQIHSNIVTVVEAVPGGRLPVDGLVTRDEGLPILLHFADCVPVVLFDPIQRIIAVIHAGWRGTAQNIVQNGLQLMMHEFQSEPTKILAAIGPAIGSCCYPTSEEAIIKLAQSIAVSQEKAAFAKLAIDLVEGKSSEDLGRNDVVLQDKVWQTITKLPMQAFFIQNNRQIAPDLKAINAFQLMQMGVKIIDVINLCTACHPKLFYSHRQSGGKTGRQGIIASLT